MSPSAERFDVAVIGGGLAGLCAATAAAKEGARAVVIRRGLGATAMSSGGLDFPLRLPLLFGRGGDAGPSGRAGRGSGADSDLGHRSGSGPDPVEAASVLRDWFASAGADLVGQPGEGLPLLDVAGHVRHTNLALAQHAAGRVDRWIGKRVLFLGVEGYAPYRPEWTARMAVSLGLVEAGRTAVAAVPAPGLGGQTSLPSARIAKALDDPDAAAAFGATVAVAARRAGADLVALPPVLGLDHATLVYERTAAALEEAFRGPGVTAFELLAAPPSVPGQRLQGEMERIARAAGVETVPGRVTGVERAITGAEVALSEPGELPSGAAPPGSIVAIAVDSHGRGLTIEAAEFVLATGAFAAGGLKAEGQAVFEPVFGLPVFAPPPPGWPPGEVPVGRRPVREMVWDRFASRHPVFESGLAVDADLRPLDCRSRDWPDSNDPGPGAPGQPRFVNLRAAGSVIGGYNRFADGAGAGVAVTTGLRAGRLAAAAVAAERRLPA